MDQTLWREFGAELRRRGLDYSEGVELLISWFIEHGLSLPSLGSSDDKQQGYRIRNTRYHQLLEVILEGGSPSAKEAIVKNLRMMAYAAKIAGPKSDDQMDSDLNMLIDGLVHLVAEVEERSSRATSKRVSRSVPKK